ncbi:F-box domain-containing protein [Mycena kentingensis (nom. inval.)]|nr:F-box domain-containing protein [Mycena kentingensis (nom. inval.)]
MLPFSFLYDLFARPTTPVHEHPPTHHDVHLPLEVAFNIIEAAYHSEDADRRQLLRHCALVCRDWSFLAQRLLFRDVAITSRPSYTSFLAAVDRSTSRGCFLGDAVMSMHLVIDHNDQFGLSPACFAHAVASCPKLVDLHLAVYGSAQPGNDVLGLPDLVRMRRAAPSFDDATLERLRTGPSIRALEFSNWSENSAAIVQLLDVWPSLKRVAFSGTPPQLPPTSLPPFPGAIEELRVNCQSAVQVDFMTWLLRNSAKSLHTLELEREQPNEVIDYLVEGHGATVRSLALPACTTHAHAAAVRKCTRLRELRIEAPWVTPVLFKPFPAELEHLALAIDQDSAIQPLLDAIRHTEGALKAVTLQVWDKGESNAQLPVLKMACALRGIELGITTDIQTFRTVVRRDPAVASPFARAAEK